jgi:ribosomal protein S27E
MIQVKCPHCSRDIRAADEHAGKKIRCPGCKEVLPLPAAATAVQTAAPRPAPAAIQKAPPKRRPAEEDDEDVPILEAIEDDDDADRRVRKRKRAEDDDDDSDDDDEEYERRRRKRRKERSRRGAYADCPECSNRGDATSVGFTWWGGIVGPALLSHVRCNRCGTCYNGKSGKSNSTAIAIYVGVGLLIGIVLGGCGLIAAILGNH